MSHRVFRPAVRAMLVAAAVLLLVPTVPTVPAEARSDARTGARAKAAHAKQRAKSHKQRKRRAAAKRRRHRLLAKRAAAAAPTAPVLSGTAGDGSASLTWTASSGAALAGYRVYRRAADATTWPSTPLASVPSSTLSYRDAAVTNGTTYAYRVNAYTKKGGVSASSNTVSLTPQAPATTTTPTDSTTTTPTTTTPTDTTTTTTTTTSPKKLLWGAWIGKQFTGTEAPWDWNAVTSFEQRNAASKHISVAHWSSPWKSSTGTYGFGTSTFQSVRDHGAIPLFSWANSGIADRDVASGAWDGYITSWATAARSWGRPFMLRYNWEMNGSWFSWGVGNSTTQNTAAEYVAAWRHVHDLFKSAGATNATWVWCPNIDPGGKLADLRGLYPGDGYVDWTCLDGYNGNVPWTSFTDLFGRTYDLITTQIAPSKPMIVGEVGSTESGGSKAQWISDMMAALPARFPQIRGLVWFDKNESGPGGYTDWPLESSGVSSSAFAAGVGSSSFAGNDFATASTSPIPAP